jgi:hypothetical protein
MAIINYDQEHVKFDRKVGSWGSPAVPSLKFFIHVWQRGQSIEDVLETFEHVYQKEYKTPGKLNEGWSSVHNARMRAKRWRTDGVPLHYLPRSKPFGLEDAIKFAQEETS